MWPASAISHSLGIMQKRSHITLEDIVSFMDGSNLPDCKGTARFISSVVASFPDRCREAGIQGEWTDKIWSVIKTLLI